MSPDIFYITIAEYTGETESDKFKTPDKGGSLFSVDGIFLLKFAKNFIEQFDIRRF